MLEFLSKTLFTISGQPISVGQLLLVPVLLLISYLLTNWVSRLISKRLAARHMSADVIQLLVRIFYILVIAIVVVTTLGILNIPLTAFAFVSGAIAIGVGFGAQNIINNFISGWILMWEKPIKIGDFLEVNDTKGTVEAINTRSTRIRRVDGVHLLVPNSFLLENTVVNWTLVDDLARSIVRVGVAYGSPVRLVSQLIEQAVSEHQYVLQDPKPVVIFEDFGDNALVFDAYFWVNAAGDRNLRVIRSDLRYRIEELFNQNNIVIAFPQRDVHIDGTLQLSDTRAEAVKSQVDIAGNTAGGEN